MNVITYGEHTIDPTKLPVESINALLRRGVSHFLGNEQASKLTAWVESVTKDGGAVPDDSAKAAKKTELIKAAIEALASGTVGTRVSGPRVEPIEATRNAIAKKEVLDILRAANIKVPKGEEAVRFADGTQKTLAQMVATRLEKFGDRNEKEPALGSFSFALRTEMRLIRSRVVLCSETGRIAPALQHHHIARTHPAHRHEYKPGWRKRKHDEAGAHCGDRKRMGCKYNRHWEAPFARRVADRRSCTTRRTRNATQIRRSMTMLGRSPPLHSKRGHGLGWHTVVHP